MSEFADRTEDFEARIAEELGKPPERRDRALFGKLQTAYRRQAKGESLTPEQSRLLACAEDYLDRLFKEGEAVYLREEQEPSAPAASESSDNEQTYTYAASLARLQERWQTRGSLPSERRSAGPDSPAGPDEALESDFKYQPDDTRAKPTEQQIDAVLRMAEELRRQENQES